MSSLRGLMELQQQQYPHASSTAQPAEQPPRPEPSADDIMNLPIMNPRQPGRPSPGVEVLDSLLKDPRVVGQMTSVMKKIIVALIAFILVSNPITSKLISSNGSAWSRFGVQIPIFIGVFAAANALIKNK